MDGCMYDWKRRNVVNFAALQRVWLESLVQLKMETETETAPQAVHRPMVAVVGLVCNQFGFLYPAIISLNGCLLLSRRSFRTMHFHQKCVLCDANCATRISRISAQSFLKALSYVTTFASRISAGGVFAPCISTRGLTCNKTKHSNCGRRKPNSIPLASR